MTIRQISLNDFRNLQSTTLDLHESFNFISGLNASGKTNFLEALHVLCQGQSFKTHLLDQCIQHDKNGLLLFALFQSHKVGLSRSSKKTLIRIDNTTIHKLSSLAKRTPVRIINNSSLNLIIGTPAYKREFIDWLLFHVEHDYQSLWLKHKHALKQRNALLKSKRNNSELNYWDKHLSELSEEIYRRRKKYIDEIIKVYSVVFPEIIESTPVNILYEPGWDIENSLEQILLSNRHKDLKSGFTRYGSHRDDIKFTSDDIAIQTIFSRGQIKKISIALCIAQVYLLSTLTAKKVVFLVDDIDSELDELSVNYLLDKLKNKGLQLFITNIKMPARLLEHHEEYKMFHVEHGMIKTVNNP